jgi:hypothetical protein
VSAAWGGASLIKHGRFSNRARANRKLVNEKLRDLRLHGRDPEEWARKHGIDLDALQADLGADEDRDPVARSWHTASHMPHDRRFVRPATRANVENSATGRPRRDPAIRAESRKARKPFILCSWREDSNPRPADYKT